jgi:hypothetical protein
MELPGIEAYTVLPTINFDHKGPFFLQYIRIFTRLGGYLGDSQKHNYIATLVSNQRKTSHQPDGTCWSN